MGLGSCSLGWIEPLESWRVFHACSSPQLRFKPGFNYFSFWEPAEVRDLFVGWEELPLQQGCRFLWFVPNPSAFGNVPGLFHLSRCSARCERFPKDADKANELPAPSRGTPFVPRILPGVHGRSLMNAEGQKRARQMERADFLVSRPRGACSTLGMDVSPVGDRAEPGTAAGEAGAVPGVPEVVPCSRFSGALLGCGHGKNKMLRQKLAGSVLVFILRQLQSPTGFLGGFLRREFTWKMPDPT